MFLWDLKLSELHNGHNVELEHCANKKNLQLMVCLRNKTRAYFTFILSEENELLFQCRVQCKRRNKYLEHICLDVIICT